jgi:hypothetical protein
MDLNLFIIIFTAELLLFLILIYLIIKADDWICKRESRLKKEARQLLFIVVTSKELLRSFNISFERILGLSAFDITGFIYFIIHLYSDLKRLTKIKGGFLAKLHILKIITNLVSNKNRFLATIAAAKLP